MSDALGFFGEKVAFDELASALSGCLRDGDASVVLSCSKTAPVSRSTLHALHEEGQFEEHGRRFDSLRIPREVRDAVGELRAASYREGTGTWFSAKFTVTAAGAFTAEYNYDEEPEWTHELDSIAYVTDQKRFPRDEEHQPEWLKAKLAEGHVRIAERDAREARERGQ